MARQNSIYMRAICKFITSGQAETKLKSCMKIKTYSLGILI